MYLPELLYARAPQYWLFVGMLLVVLGLYLGIQVNRTFLFVGLTLGVASCAWGVRVLLRRTGRPDEETAPGTSSTDR